MIYGHLAKNFKGDFLNFLKKKSYQNNIFHYKQIKWDLIINHTFISKIDLK